MVFMLADDDGSSVTSTRLVRDFYLGVDLQVVYDPGGSEKNLVALLKLQVLLDLLAVEEHTVLAVIVLNEVSLALGDDYGMVAGAERIRQGDVIVSRASQAYLGISQCDVEIVTFFGVHIYFRHGSPYLDYNLYIGLNSSKTTSGNFISW